MAFLDVVGELLGFSSNKAWTLTGIDPKSRFFNVDIEGQFTAQNFSERGGDSELGEASSVNTESPNFQFLSNQGETVTFQTRIYATDSFKNVKQKLEVLKSTKKRENELKRPPRFLFTFGTEIKFTCFVRRVDFDYDELRSDGSVRGAIANISLQKLDEEPSKNAATSLASQIKFAAGVVAGAAGIVSQVKNRINIPGGSIHTIDRTRTVKSGDTFESIAQDEYGNALQGDVLRRAQPEKARISPGDEIILVDPTEINSIEVTPQAVALKDTLENRQLKKGFFERRNRKTTIFV